MDVGEGFPNRRTTLRTVALALVVGAALWVHGVVFLEPSATGDAVVSSLQKRLATLQRHVSHATAQERRLAAETLELQTANQALVDLLQGQGDHVLDDLTKDDDDDDDDVSLAPAAYADAQALEEAYMTRIAALEEDIYQTSLARMEAVYGHRYPTFAGTARMTASEDDDTVYPMKLLFTTVQSFPVALAALHQLVRSDDGMTGLQLEWAVAADDDDDTAPQLELVGVRYADGRPAPVWPVPHQTARVVLQAMNGRWYVVLQPRDDDGRDGDDHQTIAQVVEGHDLVDALVTGLQRSSSSDRSLPTLTMEWIAAERVLH
jgi:hypothetical protein